MSNFVKRTVPVILVLALCFTCLFSPVSASSFDTGIVNYYNLLDYDTADDNNSVTSGSDLIVQLDYSLPEANNVTAVDLVIYTASGTITEAYGGRPGASNTGSAKDPLSIEAIGNRIFRVYGNIPNANYSEIEITLLTSASGTICTVNSFLVWNARFDYFEETGILAISDYDSSYERYVQNSYGASCNHGMSAQSGTSAQGLAIASFYVPNWVKYDYVQIYGSAYTSNITSITARYNQMAVPFTCTYLSGSVSDSLDSACSRRDFLITLDLRGLDRTIATDNIMPDVTLELPYPLAQGGSVALYRVHGFIQQETFNPIIHYFRNIFSELSLFRTNFFSVLGSLQTNLSTWFTDLGNYLGGILITLNDNMNAGFTNIASKLNTNLSNLSTFFEDILTSLTNLRTTLGSKIDSMKESLLTNLGTWFDNVQTSLTTLRTTLGSKIDSMKESLLTNLGTWFEDVQTSLTNLRFTLGSKIDSMKDTINTTLNNFYGMVSNGFSTVWNYLETGFKNMVSGFQTVNLSLDSIWLKIDDLIRGTTQQNQNADDFNDTVDDQAGELDDLTGDLNSVTRPPLDDVDVSINGMVDSNIVVLATGGLSSVLSNSIILRLLIMSLTLALAGFILFGKR